jgi:hypothetical protein
MLFLYCVSKLHIIYLEHGSLLAQNGCFKINENLKIFHWVEKHKTQQK